LTEKSIDKVVNKAQKYFERGDIQGMLRLRDELLNLAPGSAELDFVTGSLHRLMGDDDLAYTALSRAVEKDPSQFLPRFSRDLADLAIQAAQSSRSRYRRRELLEDALWYLDQKMKPARDPSRSLLEKVRLLLVLDRPDEAKALCVERDVVFTDASALACLRELLSSAEATAAETAVRTVHPAGHDELVTLPITWWKVRPVFPELARVARIEGRVVIQALVSQDGTVTDLEVLECNRPASVAN
jgi:tetratricopeptide (TPR) repeat protein